MLGQACAHCPKFLTAASRRSLGRIAVPVWLIILSDQLPIVALVGCYPANQLIGRGPLLQHLLRGFPPSSEPGSGCGISDPFGSVSPTGGQVTHALLSRSPLGHRSAPVRLACFRHAASVCPEPGSNSPSKKGLPKQTFSFDGSVSLLTTLRLLRYRASIAHPIG